MGHRLSKIYTRTGDTGTTGLGSGERVDKDSLRIEAIGQVDELNCAVGIVLAQDIRDTTRDCLNEVQHKLFDLGGELSMPGYQAIRPDDVASLEEQLDTFNEALPPLQEFILPGGGPAAAACHMARAICRRSERCIVTLSRHEQVSPEVQAYLNRLSDLLFVLCRILGRDEGGIEVLWRNEAKQERQKQTER